MKIITIKNDFNNQIYLVGYYIKGIYHPVRKYQRYGDSAYVMRKWKRQVKLLITAINNTNNKIKEIQQNGFYKVNHEKNFNIRSKIEYYNKILEKQKYDLNILQTLVKINPLNDENVKHAKQMMQDGIIKDDWGE